MICSYANVLQTGMLKEIKRKDKQKTQNWKQKASQFSTGHQVAISHLNLANPNPTPQPAGSQVGYSQ